MMKAVTWQGREKVRVDEVPDPRIEQPTDAIIRVTSTGLCGSDLHLYAVLGMFIDPGDVLGHEPMGIVEEVGAEVDGLSKGDRVVIPFNISCGHCWMCERQLFAQCETTQNHDSHTGASLFGYTKLYGQVPGGQAEYLRVPHADFGPIKVPGNGVPDDRFVFLSDVLPTSWQAVEYAAVPDGGSVAIFGLGPIGQMSARIANHKGLRAIGIDLVPQRLEMARTWGIEVLDVSDAPGDAADIAARLRELTDGRGPDAAIDAVGMEAHGAPVAELAQKAGGFLPDAVAKPVIQRAGIDRLSALLACFESVRRGGTVSISGVYGGAVDPLPMMQLFDKGIQIRMGQAHVKRWIDDIMPLVTHDDDPLGTETFATHRLPLAEAPEAYARFQRKQDGMFKVVFQP
jgi:threonine dehydrogenase-like Zn-dependent dehydrogenase